MESLFDSGGHRNIMFDEMCSGEMVQANQHVIVHGKEAMVLDPGGHKVFARLFAEMSGAISPSVLKYVFLSHQDPDIVAAINGWLMASDATALAPSLWMRFIPHFGVDEYAVKRMQSIPDEGMKLALGGANLEIVPAHYLHSPGNFQVYDPTSKILYSGDFGASIGHDYRYVKDFDAHVPYMQGFHQRYMASNKAIKRWLAIVQQLDIETVAPQHGAMFRGRELVQRFFAWAQDLPCGVDLYP